MKTIKLRVVMRKDLGDIKDLTEDIFVNVNHIKRFWHSAYHKKNYVDIGLHDGRWLEVKETPSEILIMLGEIES